MPSLTWMRATERWLRWLRAADRSDQTIKLRHYQLRRLAETSPDPWAIDTDQMAFWLGNPNWSTETRRSMRSAIRSFYGWAHASGLIGRNPAALLPPIKPKAPNPRPIPDEVLDRALAIADPRQRLMILLGCREGMRRGEIAAVHPRRDLERTAKGWTLTVHGKGRKIRIMPISDELARSILGSAGDGYLFPGGYNGTGYLSPYWVGRLIRRCLVDAWTSHTLRHRFANKVYEGTENIYLTMNMLGHTRTETTERYVKKPFDAMREALKFAA